jgi:AcrR family transcriptional regulator
VTRADARRNRERVLNAADVVFGEHGGSASTEDVARAAGVGIGTVFRHFPTKEALLEAVYLRHLHRAAEELEALADNENPGAALAGFVARMVDRSRSKSVVADALSAGSTHIDPSTSEIGQRLSEALAGLLDRAQRAGAVRPDIGVPGLIALIVGASRAADYSGWDPGVHEQILTVILDGLHPGAAKRAVR